MGTLQTAAFGGVLAVISLGVSATPVVWQGNGHSYEVVQTSGYLSWEDAQIMASGQGGYLATLTSAAENQFVWDLIAAATGQSTGPFNLARWFWLGGHQTQPVNPTDEPSGGWAWVTGEPWGWTNWSPTLVATGNCPSGGIPAPWDNCQNIARGAADYLHYVRDLPGGLWGDVEGGQTNMTGYVLEVGNPVPSPGIVALLMLGMPLLMYPYSRHKRPHRESQDILG